MATVAALRKQWPKIDGPVVFLVVLVIAGGLVFQTTAMPIDWKAFAQKLVAVFVSAVGTNALVSSWANKAAPATLQGNEVLVSKVDETARPGDAGNSGKPPDPPPAA
jgi:hypothetical protein